MNCLTGNFKTLFGHVNDDYIRLGSSHIKSCYFLDTHNDCVIFGFPVEAICT